MIIPKKILIVMTISAIAMLIGEVMSFEHDIDYFGWRLWGYISISVIAAICCIIDVVKNKNPRKIFWIISVIIFGSLGSFVYLIQKKDDK